MDAVSVERPKQRTYSDADKAKALIALDLNGGNVKYTAEQLNIPRITLHSWKEGEYLNDDVLAIRHNKTQDLADKFESLAHLYIGQAIQTVDSAKGTNAITGAAVAVDKMRLLRDQSTANIDVRSDAINALIAKGIVANIEDAKALLATVVDGELIDGETD